MKNYEYPKVHLDPTTIYAVTGNGRKYYSLSYRQLWNYYRSYALGGGGGYSSTTTSALGERRGNERATWLARADYLKRTMYPNEVVFSGQEKEGYIIFEPLATDVSEVVVYIEDLVLRFDFSGIGDSPNRPYKKSH